ncbi:uncharacterized protein LOC142768793 isoform X2 [Rhipicephalus microplus]|uniref:uncharacterized protein LOC142768793 isoform X2 n=1 Tax=Rhipicephalus microplus TaxID=6941 RepID=UPI003F6BCD68
MVRKAASKRKLSSTDIEGQCCQKSRKTVCCISMTRGTCVFLSVFVFSFGALLCAFLMNVTDRWELQVIAYGIATVATIASLFFISFARTSPDDADVSCHPKQAASSLRHRRQQAAFESGRCAFIRPSDIWMPDWKHAGALLCSLERDDDWFVLPRQGNQQRSHMVPAPIQTPVHRSPPSSTALMTFEDAMIWSPLQPTPPGLLHI